MLDCKIIYMYSIKTQNVWETQEQMGGTAM